MLISPYFLFAAFLLATLAKLSKREYEHAFTRFLMTVFYFALAIQPDMPMELSRMYSRWFLSLLAGVEVLSYALRLLSRKGRKKHGHN
jgi:asparagine N-glycosylation enzyme membrane subunit Stt3